MESNTVEKKNFIDYMLIAIALVCMVLVLVSGVIDSQAKVSGAALGVLIVVQGIVSPLNDYFIKGQLRSRWAILVILIRVVLVTALIISGSQALYSKNYNLKYTYWVAFISLVIIIIGSFIEHTVNKYRMRKAENVDKNLLITILGAALYLFVFVAWGHNIIYPYLQPKRQVVLDNLKTPSRITIYKHDKEQTDFSHLGSERLCELTSPEGIEKIISELRNTEISSLSSTDLINHQKMRDDSFPYYRIYLDYTGTSDAPRKLENGYIDQIVLTSSRNATIEEMNFNATPVLFRQFRNDVYPIGLSEDTMDMIFGWIGERK